MSKYMKASFIAVLLGFASGVTGQTDHSGHMTEPAHNTGPSYTSPKVKGELQVLQEVPASGRARESGFDGRSIMETTSASDKLAEKCAKGSRGLVALDNRTWQLCGSRPEGLPDMTGTSSQKGHVDHSSH